MKPWRVREYQRQNWSPGLCPSTLRNKNVMPPIRRIIWSLTLVMRYDAASEATRVRATMRGHLSLLLLLKVFVGKPKSCRWDVATYICVEELLRVIDLCTIDRDWLVSFRGVIIILPTWVRGEAWRWLHLSVAKQAQALFALLATHNYHIAIDLRLVVIV